MTGLDELREQGKMTRIEQEHGWVAPEEIVTGTLEGCVNYRWEGARHKFRFSPSG